jgi:hypothetical protein
MFARLMFCPPGYSTYLPEEKVMGGDELRSGEAHHGALFESGSRVGEVGIGQSDEGRFGPQRTRMQLTRGQKLRP